MKVGEYVRTPLGITKYLGKYEMFDGSIAEDLHEFDGLNESLWSGDLYGVVFDCDLEDIVLKSSSNIIDLIEVGDYVNGKKVIDTFTDYIFDYSEEFKVIRFSETDILHDVKHIKSIVTKEQFESMQYNLESEVN